MKSFPDFPSPSLDSCRRVQRQGFTLVELLVSIALFSILVSIAAGGFVNALRTERQAAAMMAAESNVSIALEQMAREMRTGYLFCNDIANNGNPTAICQNPGSVYGTAINPSSGCTVDISTNPSTWLCRNFLEYYNAQSEKVDYLLTSDGTLERSVDGDTPQAITGDNVSIQYLTFTLFGNVEGDHWNPRVTVSVGVAPHDSTVNWTTANLETTVSARQIDCTQGGSPSC
jgi:prepilin-type N-terminal cleavage/methylation domain-containing protein